MEVKSGEIAFAANHTCRSRTVFIPAGSKEITRDVEATYIRDGDTLEMKWKGAGTTRGTVERDRFTLDNEGIRFTYQR